MSTVNTPAHAWHIARLINLLIKLDSANHKCVIDALLWLSDNVGKEQLAEMGAAIRGEVKHEWYRG